jgi:hypothetical protein
MWNQVHGIETNITSDHLVVPIQKPITVATTLNVIHVNSTSEESPPKQNKVCDKLDEMVFDVDNIDKYVSCGLT